MGLLDGVKGLLMKWMRILPAQGSVQIQVRETMTKELNVLKNQLWYRGDPVELEQFFKQISQVSFDGYSMIPSTKFWAASPVGNSLIRKMHSGLPRMIADKLASIVAQDMMEPEMDGAMLPKWRDFVKDSEFTELLKEAIVQVLTEGDGAFKICVDPELSDMPLLEFYSGNSIEYKYKRRKLIEVQFFTDYFDNRDKQYKLVEFYGKNYVRYKLLNNSGAEVPLDTLTETATLADVTFTGDYLMAVPLRFSKSAKWPERGESIFEGKNDMFDAFDECLSTWMDALRAGRVKQYIPDTLIPRDEETGAMMKPDVFNPYIAIGTALQEDMKVQIEVKQGDIDYEGLLTTYVTLLDGCLQGLISPSTLGIDVKKLDNAESQREKEKTTLYTRDSMIDVLGKVLPKLVEAIMMTQSNIQGVAPECGCCPCTFEWGQYANPSFESMVETIGKAKTFGIMSIEQCVEELYGDDMSDEDKAEEVERIRAEQTAATQVGEPAVNDDMTGDGGEGDESKL